MNQTKTSVTKYSCQASTLIPGATPQLDLGGSGTGFRQFRLCAKHPGQRPGLHMTISSSSIGVKIHLAVLLEVCCWRCAATRHPYEVAGLLEHTVMDMELR